MSIAQITEARNPQAVNWNSAPALHVRRADGGYYVEVLDHDEGRLWVANRELLDRDEAQTLADSLGATLAEVARQKRLVRQWDGFEENLRLDREKAEILAGRLVKMVEEPVTEEPPAPASAYTRRELAPLIDAAVAKLHCGPRAVKAAELLLAGAVTRHGPDAFTVASQAGNGSYTVSLKGGCECLDNAPQDWCKHRIACGFAARLGIQPEDPGRLLSGILAQSGGEPVDLKIRRHYSGSGGHPDTDFWQSYRTNGGPWVELPEALDISGHGPFWRALEASGWHINEHRRAKGGMTFVWTLKPHPVPVEWPQREMVAAVV